MVITSSNCIIRQKTDLVCGVWARVSLDSRNTVDEAYHLTSLPHLVSPGSEEALAPRSAARDHGHCLETYMQSSSHAICIDSFPIYHLAICIYIYIYICKYEYKYRHICTYTYIHIFIELVVTTIDKLCFIMQHIVYNKAQLINYGCRKLRT